ncbi:MAG: CBS domain-containing protein [Bacilli bacterium]
MKDKDDVIYVYNNSKVKSLLNVVKKHNYSRIPGLDKKTKKIVGIVHQSDILNCELKDEKYAINSLMTTPTYIYLL